MRISSPDTLQDPNRLDTALLERYWFGEATEDEVSYLQRWFAAHPESSAKYERLNASLRTEHKAGGSGAERARRINAILATVQEKTPKGAPERSQEGTAEPVAVPATIKGRTAWTTRTIASVGSAIALSLILITGGFWLRGASNAKLIASDVSSYTTERGQRSKIVLPDGSVVHLNVGSRLEVPMNYSEGNRTLTLSGNAHFSVVPRNNAPFVVLAGTSVTRVLGTRFSVRRYPSDSSTVIAVQDGKIAVGDHVLSAHQQITLNNSGASSILPADSAQFTFVSGVLTIRSTSLPNAIPELNRWYNADIRLGDPSLATRKIVGGFIEGSTTDLAAILELTFNVRVVRTGRILTLYPRNDR